MSHYKWVLVGLALIASLCVLEGCRTVLSTNPVTGAVEGHTEIDPCSPVAKTIDKSLAISTGVLKIAAPHIPLPWKLYITLAGTILLAFRSIWTEVKQVKIIKGAKAAAYQLKRLKADSETTFDRAMAGELKAVELSGAIMPDNL